ncbi:MAG TPA: TonB-dependent siderophore receptor [Chitinophagaceae bacterium]|nr:TonB-dependent siderophore receptor [Chitinophagaceae bacterium]
MRTLTLFIVLTISLNCLAQSELTNNDRPSNVPNEISFGSISGQIKTTDGLPAAFVTVVIKENGKSALTDENGFFEIKNLKQGVYTLEVSMVGLKSQQKIVEIKKTESIFVSISLEEDAKQLAEVMIESKGKKLSIGKINIADKDFPQSTGIIPNKIIHDQQAIRLGDIVKNVPGVSLVQTRYGVNETYGARGYIIGVTGGAGGGSIFKNGLPTNIAGMPEAATLESVEIIKGSSAFLYGSSSGGLIINMITKKPEYNFGGEVSMNIGNNQQYKPVIDVYGPVSKNLAFRIVGTYENDRSYRDVVKTIRPYVNPSLMYKFGNNSTLIIQGDYLNAQLTPDPGVGLLDSGRVLSNAIPRSRFQNVRWAYNNVKQGTVSAEFKHRINDQFSLNASASYQNTDVDSYGCGNLNTASKTGIIARPLARAHSIEKDYAVQINLEGKFNTKKIEHHFLAGIDFTGIVTSTDAFNIYDANGSILKTYDTINLLNPDQYIQRTDIPAVSKTAITKAPSDRTGVFVQDLVSITKQIKLFAAVRYSYQATVQTTIDSIATSTRPASTTSGSTPTTRYNILSPKLGIVYQPATNTSFYASYSNSFTTNTGVDVNGNLLPASIINQYEIGAKNNFLNGKITATASIYRILNSHLAQQAAYLADGVTPNTNSSIKTLSGETTSDGIEVGLNGDLSKNVYFVAGYSYNNIRFTHTLGTKGSNIEGEELVNAPKNTINGSIFYAFPSRTLKGFKVGISGFFTGARFGGYNNTVGQSILGSRMVALSGFTTIDLSAGYTYKRFALQCKLSNIFNALNYLVHDNYSITPIAPRQIAVRVLYKF